MTESPQPTHDPVEEAVATVLLHGGGVELETDRLDAPEIRSAVRVSYRGRNRKRIALAGSVTAWADKQGAALVALGWVPADVLEMGRLDRTWTRQAEERLLERGIDYRLGYGRSWELPPSTADEVAADLRATFRILDDRPAEEVRYAAQRDGPLEKRVVRSGMGFGLFSLLIGVFVTGYMVFRPQHVESGLVARAVIAGILTLLVIFFPVRRRIERTRGAGKWGWLPLWLAMLVLPAVAVFAWGVWGF